MAPSDSLEVVLRIEAKSWGGCDSEDTLALAGIESAEAPVSAGGRKVASMSNIFWSIVRCVQEEKIRGSECTMCARGRFQERREFRLMTHNLEWHQTDQGSLIIDQELIETKE